MSHVFTNSIGSHFYWYLTDALHLFSAIHRINIKCKARAKEQKKKKKNPNVTQMLLHGLIIGIKDK